MHSKAGQVHTQRQYKLGRSIAATERRWKGELHPNYTVNFCQSAQSGERVAQNIQVDSEKSLLLVTELGDYGYIGRIVVRSLLDSTRPTLFTLNMDTYDIIHSIKLSNGFLVCKTQHKLSLWRWAEDQQRDPVSLEPASWQTALYENAMQLAGLQSDTPNRGELIPVANITRPRFSLYFLVRFVYPTLCLWSTPCDPIWFWDAKSRSFTQTIPLDPNGASGWHCPLDFNDTHIFTIPDKIQIYNRATGDLTFQLDYDCIDRLPRRSTLPTLSHRFYDGLFEKYTLANCPPHLPRILARSRSDRDYVLEVYSSPDGNGFVGIMRSGRILHCAIVPEPSRLHPSDNIPEDIEFRMSFTRVHNILWTAAYDGRRIVAYGVKSLVLLTPEGLSIIHLVDQPGSAITTLKADGSSQLLYPFPAKTMYHIPAFRANTSIEHARVELTRDTCWLTRLQWPPNMPYRHTVGMVDFAQEFDPAGANIDVIKVAEQD
ncbi:unnamed protein product [Rhizoctonia solani]|uniref:Uncharacterized protein n=1 Tax=Rhizoctonia solani TaxID=456999 RepID=A0A8H3DVI9_9AGAM|nr:unnamed protein product [Rhizoctonia solani]